MSNEDLEEIRRQLQQMKIITSALKIENRTLQDRVNRLENESTLDFKEGERIKILNPTCPGMNRKVAQQDSLATVTKVTSKWIHFTCDSGVRSRRIRDNARRIQND